LRLIVRTIGGPITPPASPHRGGTKIDAPVSAWRAEGQTGETLGGLESTADRKYQWL
jgi:hypothetical protein